MPIKNPNTPYERAYNAWSYGGGQQRGEPMPRARDFPSSDRRDPYASEYAEYQRRSDEPYGGRGAQGIWEGPQAPYQGGSLMDDLGTYDPRTSPQPPITDWRQHVPLDAQEVDPRVYNAGGSPRAQQGGPRYSGMGGEEQRRVAESPAVVQRAREFERRRRRPQGGRGAGASLGSLNRR
jgi:hypothetical protein